MFPLYDTNPHHRFPFFTLGIIAINVVVMVWIAQMPEAEMARVYAEYGFVPKRIEQLQNPQLLIEVNVDPRVEEDEHAGPSPEVVQLPPERNDILLSMLTMMFLHGGWLHLVGNMWFLWIFGNNVEDRLGHLLYVVFYLVGGLSALAVHWLTAAGSTVPVIGASGAVAAVLGAYAVTYPHARVRTLIFLVIFVTIVDLPALLVLALWFVQQLIAAMNVFGGVDLGGGVAWWAHVGGFIAGAVLMPILASMVSPPGDEGREGEAQGPFS